MVATGSGDAFVVAVHDDRGSPAGLGVLVGPREVITCAHVVASALGLPPDSPERPDASVAVRWPRLDDTAPVTADVVDWLAVEDGDLAALVLRQDAPPGAAVARLVEQPGRLTDAATQLKVFGYPAGRPRGQWTQVRIVGPVKGGLLQLNTVDVSLPDVRAGFSGSPVYDPKTGAVAGVVAQAPRGGSSHDSLAIPTEHLLAFRPGLTAGRTAGLTGERAGWVRPERLYPRHWS